MVGSELNYKIRRINTEHFHAVGIARLHKLMLTLKTCFEMKGKVKLSAHTVFELLQKKTKNSQRNTIFSKKLYAPARTQTIMQQEKFRNSVNKTP